MHVGCDSHSGRAGGGGQGVEEVQQAGEMQGKISKRRHLSPLSLHRNLRRGRKPGMETKSNTGAVSCGKGWGRAGEGLCRAVAERDTGLPGAVGSSAVGLCWAFRGKGNLFVFKTTMQCGRM